MMAKRSGHVWHMVLMAGIVVVALWMGAGAAGALLLALLACAAMMVAMVWIALRATHVGTVDQAPVDRPPHHREAAASPDVRRRL